MDRPDKTPLHMCKRINKTLPCKTSPFASTSLQLDLKTRPHFSSRLSCKCDGRHAANFALSLTQQSYHSSDHARCLARASRRFDQHRPVQLLSDPTAVLVIWGRVTIHCDCSRVRLCRLVRFPFSHWNAAPSETSEADCQDCPTYAGLPQRPLRHHHKSFCSRNRCSRFHDRL